MNNEDKLYLIALDDLASWALEYIEIAKSITIRKEIIEGYIEHLQTRIKELERFKYEHKIMKEILIENGLWEKMLNDNQFLLKKCLKSWDWSLCLLNMKEKM